MLSGQDTMIWDFFKERYNGGSILAIECSDSLIDKIASLSPTPHIVRWTEEEQQSFCHNQWPGPNGPFSFVLLGRLIERMEDLEITKTMRDHIIEEGTLISLWGNAQHWTVARDMLMGTSCFSKNPIIQDRPHRLFSLTEIVDMFTCLKFNALRVNDDVLPIEEDSLKKLNAWCGISNRRLLETAFWCIEARLYTDDILSLRKELTPALRKELARVLRRIENDIEPEINCKIVNDAIKNHGISKKYIEAFTKNVTLEPTLVLRKLQESQNE